MVDFPFRKAPEKSEFKRKIEERKSEAERAAKNHITSADFQNIRNKLGLSQRDKDAKVIFVLKRFAKKPRTWKAIGITKDDFKKFGIIV